MNTSSNTTAMPSDKILKGFTDYNVAFIGGEKMGIKLVDILRADNIPYTHLLSPNGGVKSLTTCPSTEWFKAIKDAVALGFSPEIQKYLATPAASLTQPQKDKKKRAINDIGSRVNDIAGLLKKNPKKGPRVLLTGKAKASNDMQLFVDKVRKYSDMEHDIVQQVDLLLAMSRTFGLDVK
tara:strand:+ start:59 stop:598 length:540 start_codon:yes stop_codon:yes gene_type:complete